jgi:hypothetical protein
MLGFSLLFKKILTSNFCSSADELQETAIFENCAGIKGNSSC